MRTEPSEVAADRPGVAALVGLTSAEAAQRLRELGPNAVPEEHRARWRTLLAKFWAPVPGMLAVAILLELLLAHGTEAIVMTALLLFNGLLSFFQEERAQAALALLRQRLVVECRVLRDGHWQQVPSAVLVPGDVVHLRLGDLVPADVRLADGALLIDQSALTGESLPVELAPGSTAYAGSLIQRGEGTGEVTATGARTAYGRTAELVRVAKTPSHLESVIVRIVRALVGLDLVLVAAVLVYGAVVGLRLADTVPFALILLIASVPVALPATFTLASALGAMELARHDVLVTRLSAIEEAAGIDILCSDKTGTLTQNRLTLGALRPSAPETSESLLRLAAAASDAATQDPIDLAILAAASSSADGAATSERVTFEPFDPGSRRSTAVLRTATGVVEVTKGAPSAVAALVGSEGAGVTADAAALASQGFRVLAVAAGPRGKPRLAGLVGLQDPVRPDSGSLISRLQELGVRVLMVTGDNLVTAATVAAQLGMGDRACPAEALRSGGASEVLGCDLFARVLPEDKFRLVTALQQSGRIVGMTGDGVNDAPALKQAEVGIAVAGATDVARAAASVVLTSSGLSDIVFAIEASRRVYQRLLTYTLNKIVKTIQIALLLSVGLLVGGIFVTSPRLVVLLLFANDFVTMAIATDHVQGSRLPERWHVRPLVLSALGLAGPLLLVSFAVVWLARDVFRLGQPELQTLVFVLVVFTGQATVYLVRERAHFWHAWPSRWLGVSSLADLCAVTLLATRGWLMAPISLGLVGLVLGASLLVLVVTDSLKVHLLAWALPAPA